MSHWAVVAQLHPKFFGNHAPETQHLALTCVPFAGSKGPDAIIAVLPSTIISMHLKRLEMHSRKLLKAANGDLVTLGIRPTRAETGYGYIELEDSLREGAEPVRVRKFVEKPDRARAQEYVDGERHLWNSGMFIFQAKRMLRDLECKPALYNGLMELLPAIDTPEFSKLAHVFPRLPSISIDF